MVVLMMCVSTERAMAHCDSTEVLIVGGVACKLLMLLHVL